MLIVTHLIFFSFSFHSVFQMEQSKLLFKVMAQMSVINLNIILII